jgi:hypothetical protein
VFTDPGFVHSRLHWDLLRTYSSDSNKVDCTFWQAARATSAATVVFGGIGITWLGGTSTYYYGPDMEDSNPTEKSLQEASRVYGQERQVKCVLSIGTGKLAQEKMDKKAFAPRLVKAVIKTTKSCEHSHNILVEQFRARNAQSQFYFRFSLRQVTEDVHLHDWNHIDRLSADIKSLLAVEPMKTEIGKLAESLCDHDPRRKYQRLSDLSIPIDESPLAVSDQLEV